MIFHFKALVQAFNAGANASQKHQFTARNEEHFNALMEQELIAFAKNELSVCITRKTDANPDYTPKEVQP